MNTRTFFSLFVSIGTLLYSQHIEECLIFQSKGEYKFVE